MNEVPEPAKIKERKMHIEEQKREKIEEKVLNGVEFKERQKNENQNLKSILKKSKEELKRIRREEKQKMELQRKEEEQRKNEELLANIIHAEVPKELKEEVIVAMKNAKNSTNIVENVKLLLEAEKLQSQQQSAQTSELNGRFFADRRQQDGLLGDQLQKRVKLGPEASDPIQPGPIGFGQPQFQPNIPFPVPLMNPYYQMQMGFLHQQTGILNQGQSNFHSNFSGKKPYKPQKYKTAPCKLFHSSQGCQYGDGCHYIHDPNYAGRETPNMQKHTRSSSTSTQLLSKPPSLQKENSHEANPMNIENEKSTVVTNADKPNGSSNNTTAPNQEGILNPQPQPLISNLNTNSPLQQPQTSGPHTATPLSGHPQQPNHNNVPAEDRSNHQPNQMHKGQGVSNQPYQMQAPPFFQPSQTLNGPPLPHYFFNPLHFHPNRPFNQHNSPHPFQQPPFPLNGGPFPHFLPGPTETRGFHNNPHRVYPKLQAPGAIPFPSADQFKHRNSGHGPSVGTFHHLAYKNNVNNTNEEKQPEHNLK